MGLTARVLVTVGHVEGDFVHIDPSTPLTSDVERPATGSLETTLRCPSCGRQFAVQVCSLAEASRRRRVLLGLASLALAGAAVIGLAIRNDRLLLVERVQYEPPGHLIVNWWG